MRRAEEEVRGSGLDWTIMRPPRLTDKPAAGTYRTAIDRNLSREYTISRADLAVCILGLIGDPDTRAQARRHCQLTRAIFAATCDCTEHTFPENRSSTPNSCYSGEGAGLTPEKGS